MYRHNNYYGLYDVAICTCSLGVTATLPAQVPDYLPLSGAGSDEWYYQGQSLFHNRRLNDFRHLPSLDGPSPKVVFQLVLQFLSENWRTSWNTNFGDGGNEYVL